MPVTSSIAENTPVFEPMYTTPPETVGLALKTAAGWPVFVGGAAVKLHAGLTAVAVVGVNAVAAWL